MATVAVLIIGDEILKGTFEDQNGPWLIQRLRALGARLERLAVLPDEVEVIAEAVARCASSSDWVVTTGGVGPTHDDVTMAGIAAAFGVGLAEHPDLLALMAEWGLPEEGPARRMATLPLGAQVLHSEGFPVVVVHNVVVLPGVPRLMRRKFGEIEDRFRGVLPKTASLTVSGRESHLTATIDALVAAHPEVTVGSYPRRSDGVDTVMLTFEAEAQRDVEDAIEWARANLPALDEE